MANPRIFPEMKNLDAPRLPNQSSVLTESMAIELFLDGSLMKATTHSGFFEQRFILLSALFAVKTGSQGERSAAIQQMFGRD